MSNYALKLPGKPLLPIQKAFFTVGFGSGCDAAVAADGEQIAFSLHPEGDVLTLIPGSVKVRINGKAASSPVVVRDCDRITFGDFVLVIVAAPEAVSVSSTAAEAPITTVQCLSLLQRLSRDLEGTGSLQSALQEVLRALAEMAGAEAGHLVSEVGNQATAWEWLASWGERNETGSLPEWKSSPPAREVVSNTIVNEAIRRRRPVYVESIVGHPLGDQASILGARVFSIACLPLILGDRILGCAYLYTRTPGRSIRAASLETLGLLATQAALILASKLESRQVRRENAALRSGKSERPRLIFNLARPDHPMRELDQRLSRLAASDLNLMVLGETGVGKELVAREIHHRSPRVDAPFVAINCGAIPPSLMESILFGHAKGAFTGADRDHPGKLVEAQGGVLFLDEIGDLPLELQVKLLRVLQERRVEPLGSSKSIAVQFRVVSATHQNVAELIAQGKFRQDLYYRLAGATLRVPPLRERGDDIILLAETFLARLAPDRRLSDETRQVLLAHGWPGNVRELEQAISRAAALALGPEITSEDLELGSSLPTLSPMAKALEPGDSPATLREAQLKFTRDFVHETLERCKGVRARAASLLGVSERTLYRILAGNSESSA